MAFEVAALPNPEVGARLVVGFEGREPVAAAATAPVRSRSRAVATTGQHRRPLPRPIAYVSGHLSDGDAIPVMRLRYGGSAARWGFATYLASKDGYEDFALPTGDFAGTPEDALDCACGLYLGATPTARL